MQPCVGFVKREKIVSCIFLIKQFSMIVTHTSMYTLKKVSMKADLFKKFVIEFISFIGVICHNDNCLTL